MINRINRILHPTGLVVAFMGPDGSGKTTIINGVKANLTEAFRQSKQYHLFPKGGADGAPVKNPHELKPRGHIGSILKLFYFLYLYLLGYSIKVYPLKVKSTFIIFDRYYHDLLIDPYRYRHGAGAIWLKFIGYFIPKPDLWILLDAPATVIQQRKSEVTLEETTRQLLAYKSLFSTLHNAQIVNANQEAQEVIFACEQVIIEFMKQRTTKRYKNF